MRLSFRPMLTADLPWVAACEEELHLTPWSAGNFADSLTAGYSCWLAMEEGDSAPAPVGYAVLMVVLDEAHLLNITVAGAHQRRGIGGALLAFLFDRARKAGASQMFLEVRPTNESAQALYRRNGFQLIGRRKGYYPGLEGREDALVMRLPL
jgi:[ribosomal protein S18]-alanine N-acetyltransferase